MSNKVTNIYIDTTGFCDDAINRVNKALNTIVEHNAVESVYPSQVKRAFRHNVTYFNRDGAWYYAHASSRLLEGKRNVGLWALEYIAFRCKQEKKEESLLTRNIYIDARKLTQEERLDAYQALGNVASGSERGWAPSHLADYAEHDEALILFDVFAIDKDGHRLFFSGDHIGEMHVHLQKPQELTFDQLMSLTR